MNQTTKSKMSKPASTEAVKFTDGMLVTADDLNAAMHYPLTVAQVLFRSYFGCGIVCGLEVTDPNGEGKQGAGGEAAYAQQGASPGSEPKRGFVVEIARGAALGCDGYPVELCEKVKLDLSPDPCGCPITATVPRFIAIKRETAPEAPARSCGCGPAAGDSGQQCSRVRDHVVIQAFEEQHLPKGICMQGLPKPNGDARPGPCECMKQCPDCDCCADPWVLLAIVQIDANGLVAGRINHSEDVAKYGRPLYVKPIVCICGSESEWQKRYEALEERLGKLEKRAGAATSGSPPAATPRSTATPAPAKTPTPDTPPPPPPTPTPPPPPPPPPA